VARSFEKHQRKIFSKQCPHRSTRFANNLSAIEDYEESLKRELSTGGNSAEKIISEINDSVIKAIRPELIDAYNANLEEFETEKVEIEQGLNEDLKKFPAEMEKIINESNYRATVYSIARAYGLNVSQMGALEKAVTNLITGTIHPDKFADSLEDDLELPSEKMTALINDINERIFKKIREKIIEKTKTTTPNEEKDNSILSSAGIEILPVGKTAEKPKGDKERDIHPMLIQKLSVPVQTQVKKTGYVLDNITKTSDTEIKATVAKSYPPKGDPYRLSPDS
jgi:hypothetical protein